MANLYSGAISALDFYNSTLPRKKEKSLEVNPNFTFPNTPYLPEAQNIKTPMIPEANYLPPPTTSPNLLDAIAQVESNFNPKALSPKGAFGVYQLMPKTAQKPGFGIKPTSANTPDDHRRFATDLISAMMQKYGNLDHALMAYNWGTGNVDNWLKNKGPIPLETQNYVKKVKELFNPAAVENGLY